MIFFMISIGIIFILFGVLKQKKTKRNSFSKLLKDKNDNISDFDIKLGELKREFSETILELQQEIQELKVKSDFDSQLEEIPKQKRAKIEKEEVKKEPEKIKADTYNLSNKIKVNEIASLFEQGLTLEEISEKLNINKGEVLLIKELYIR